MKKEDNTGKVANSVDIRGVVAPIRIYRRFGENVDRELFLGEPRVYVGRSRLLGRMLEERDALER